MNIKRAFIAATAALVLPGLAMAQTSFPTSVDFTNGNEGSINVELTCNSGNPLVQDFDISEAQGVTFVVNGIVADSNCSIAASGVDSGYTLSPASCDYVIVEPGGLVEPCLFTATPDSSTWTPEKVWVGAGPSIDTTADIDWFCSNASTTTDGDDEGFGGTWTVSGDDSVDVVLYPAPGKTATCSAEENTESLDSAVEGDGGCEAGNDFVIGSEDAGCTITNTVFYEGIPTLSQYGLAIMALLMLGVGFVGFRRFI